MDPARDDGLDLRLGQVDTDPVDHPMRQPVGEAGDGTAALVAGRVVEHDRTGGRVCRAPQPTRLALVDEQLVAQRRLGPRPLPQAGVARAEGPVHEQTAGRLVDHQPGPPQALAFELDAQHQQRVGRTLRTRTNQMRARRRARRGRPAAARRAPRARPEVAPTATRRRRPGDRPPSASGAAGGHPTPAGCVASRTASAEARLVDGQSLESARRQRRRWRRTAR